MRNEWGLNFVLNCMELCMCNVKSLQECCEMIHFFIILHSVLIIWCLCYVPNPKNVENVFQFQVSYSTWEQGNAEPHQDFALHIDSASAIMRNPFSEKKWRKFQLSRLFSSSNSAVKSQIIEVNLHIGENKLLDRSKI